jgi:hypothetical protein
MTQRAASGSSVFSTDSRNVVGFVHAGFDGANVTIALPSSLISAALFVVLQAGISIALFAVQITVGASFHCQGRMELEGFSVFLDIVPMFVCS